jgi:hypothetical protein
VFDHGALETFAQLGLGLAGFSGIVLVLMRGGASLTRLESDRLGIMLGSSLGATFLAVVPFVVEGSSLSPGVQCRICSAIMAAYTAGFLRYYITRTLRMRDVAPEIVHPLPFALASTGHALNLVLQVAAIAGAIACTPAYMVGLFYMLFHAAYQFGRILFIRPRVPTAPAEETSAPAVVAHGHADAEAFTTPHAPQ